MGQITLFVILEKKIALKVQLKFIRISIPFSTKQLKVYRTLSFFSNYEQYCDLKSATYGEKEKKTFSLNSSPLFILLTCLNPLLLWIVLM